MDPFINGIAWELQGKIATAQDKIIQEKMTQLFQKSMRENQMELSDALYGINTSNPIEVKRVLKKFGFEMEIKNYPPNIEFDGENIKVDMEPPKIIIYKKVLEL